ncbi:hypothetical protein [Streptomyces sp. NPDC048106]
MEANLWVQASRMTGYQGRNLACTGFGRQSVSITSVAVILDPSALLYVTSKRKDWL